MRHIFLEDFTLKDTMKVNKQDPAVQNVVVPVLPENPFLPIVTKNSGKMEANEKKKVNSLSIS